MNELAFYAHKFGIKLPEGTFPDYYNAGVIVVDKSHKDLFELPPIFDSEIISDQPWLNIQIKFLKHYKVYNLPSCFNCMCFWWDANFTNTSYIIHFAGPPANEKLNIIQLYLNHWKKTMPELWF